MLAAFLLATGSYFWGQVFWWLNRHAQLYYTFIFTFTPNQILNPIFIRVLDGLDGVVARQRNKQTDFGGYLDIVLDFTVYSIIPVALVFSHATQECMSEGQASLCASKNVHT